MITYKDWGKHLRLGNFLFLYNELNYIHKQTGIDFSLPDYYLWKYLESPPLLDDGISYQEVFHFKSHVPNQEEKQYILDFFNKRKDINVNINLGSNCQSELWWEEEKQYVLSKLKIKQDYIEFIKNKYKRFLEKPCIGIGVRLGDFLGHGVFYQIPFDWYEKALNNFFPNWKNEYNVIVFSDHIEHAKQIFNNKGWFFAEPNGTHTHANNFRDYHNDPMEQFTLGTLMSHFIIGNSTFSWHQAYYVDNFNKGTIIHTGKNLSQRGELEFGTNPDFYPKNWIKYD